MAKATKAPAVSNLFAKAKAAAPAASTSKRKQTMWSLNGSADEQSASLERDIHDILANDAIMDTAKTAKSLASKRVAEYALAQFSADYARLGVTPESPMVVSNRTGESVTFVVQDKTKTSVVNDEQVESLVDILGEDGTNDILTTVDTFAFNGEILGQEGVAEALSHAIAKLVEGDKITQEQADGLIVASTKRLVKPGTVDRLADVCGRSNVKIEQVMRTLNGPIVTYVKA